MTIPGVDGNQKSGQAAEGLEHLLVRNALLRPRNSDPERLVTFYDLLREVLD